MMKIAINFNLLTTFYANSLKISHCIIIIIVILFSFKTQHYHNEMNMKILTFFPKKKLQN